jgi:NhaP-type Na+/H+ or K+/H+ antiporter
MRADTLILVVVVAVTIGAFCLEAAGPDGARIVALTFGMILVTAIAGGLIVRMRIKRRNEAASSERPPAEIATDRDPTMESLAALEPEARRDA